MVDTTFKFEVDGKEVEFEIRLPGLQENREARKVYNTTLADALDADAPIRQKMEGILEKQGVWDEHKKAKYTSLNEELIAGIKKLEKGDKNLKLSDARKLALRMLELREELRELASQRGQLDASTAEGQAENAQFQYLVSCALVYNDSKKPYYKNYEDFLNRSEEPLAIIASHKLMNLKYNFDENAATNLPEHRFLKKFGFVDDNLRLIRKDGKFVDADNRLIDENGRYIDEDGNFIDYDGDPVDADGKLNFEFQGFVDDETGVVVGLEEPKTEEPEVEEDTQDVVPDPTSSSSV